MELGATLVKSFGKSPFDPIYVDFVDKTGCHGSRYRNGEPRIDNGK
jgi:hypothetical protein